MKADGTPLLQMWWKTFLLAILLTVGPCGCKDGAHESSNGETKEEASAVKFKVGKGLLLAEETKKAIGLEIVEISEKEFLPEFTVKSEVYETNNSGQTMALAALKSDLAKHLKVGQVVNGSLSSDAKAIRGKIARLDSQGESYLGQVEVIFQFPDTEKRFPLGTLLTVTFTLGESKTVTVVPKEAVLSASEGPFVYVVNGEHLLRTLIKTGGENKDWTEVTDGLYAGDKIVLRPVETLWMTELRAVKGGGDND